MPKLGEMIGLSFLFLNVATMIDAGYLTRDQEKEHSPGDMFQVRPFLAAGDALREKLDDNWAGKAAQGLGVALGTVALIVGGPGEALGYVGGLYTSVPR